MKILLEFALVVGVFLTL